MCAIGAPLFLIRQYLTCNNKIKAEILGGVGALTPNFVSTEKPAPKAVMVNGSGIRVVTPIS